MTYCTSSALLCHLTNDTTVSKSTVMPTVPPDLPFELLDYILQCFILSSIYRYLGLPHLWSGSENARLGICGLVCRRWAKICRPILFHTVTLRSASRLTSFLTIIKAPKTGVPAVIDYLVDIVAVAGDVSPAFWIRRLSTLAVFRNAKISIDIGPGQLRSWISVDFFALPVSLPPAALRNIHYIRVYRYDFRDTGEFLRLVCRLSNPSSCDFIECTTSSEIVIPRAASSGLSSGTMKLMGCSPMWSFMQACISGLLYKISLRLDVPHRLLYTMAKAALSLFSIDDQGSYASFAWISRFGKMTLYLWYSLGLF